MTHTTLVLLPGLLCDGEVWRLPRAQLGSFADCFVPDYGLADSLEAMAQAVLQQVPRGRFAVAGHSMGGRVALELMRCTPERIERLALLDTGVHALAKGQAGAAERAQRLDLLQTARQCGMRVMGSAWARGMVHPDRVGTPLFDEILDMISRKTPEVFEAQIQALLARQDSEAVLADVQVPTLIAVGRQDAWSPVARHQAMQQVLPRAQLAVVENSGHMTTMEQPEVVSQLLKDWLLLDD
jgi:pimeloyl-ACP methyl ester carboxylesterase